MITERKFDPRVLAIHTLRVNAKTLSAEAKLIRKEARRAGAEYKQTLHNHRRGRLREESRYTHLALAFVKGRSYLEVEQKCKVAVDFNRLREKLRRHWSEVQIGEWLNK